MTIRGGYCCYGGFSCKSSERNQSAAVSSKFRILSCRGEAPVQRYHRRRNTFSKVESGQIHHPTALVRWCVAVRACRRMTTLRVLPATWRSTAGRLCDFLILSGGSGGVGSETRLCAVLATAGGRDITRLGTWNGAGGESETITLELLTNESWIRCPQDDRSTKAH